MRSSWISGLILLASSSLAWSQEMTFKSYGKEAKNFSLAELEEMVPPKKINVIEPHESVQREYREILQREGRPEARLTEIRQMRTADPDAYDRDKNLQREELNLIDQTRGANDGSQEP